MSSAPDTSATLYGPVHLGVSGSGIETAKTPDRRLPSTNAAIVATPVNEKSLEPAKPAEAATSFQQRQRKGQGKHPRQELSPTLRNPRSLPKRRAASTF